jgi:hypothetical protein
MTNPSKRLNLFFLLLSAAALLSGLWAGLVRLGWQWPALQPTLPLSHGPLMVCGFFGTLISLERAVALRKGWAYLGVLCSGLGGLLLLFGVPGLAGPVLLTLGSLGMVAIFGYILVQHTALHTMTMALGALSWLVGNLFWLAGAPVYNIVFWWMAFLVLTIAGERLELSRVLKLTRRTQGLFLAAVLLLLAGLLLLPFDLQAGTRLAGLGLLALAAWLVTYDIARRTVRLTGLTRYIAVCLLSGYFWLAVSGLGALGFGAQMAGPRYDLILHGVFLGFVFSMVFGHAPIIFPAVLGLPLTYRPIFYAPLALLHVSLALRLFSGLLGFGWGRLLGGLLNAIAILAFAALVLLSARRSQA